MREFLGVFGRAFFKLWASQSYGSLFCIHVKDSSRLLYLLGITGAGLRNHRASGFWKLQIVQPHFTPPGSEAPKMELMDLFLHIRMFSLLLVY